VQSYAFLKRAFLQRTGFWRFKLDSYHFPENGIQVYCGVLSPQRMSLPTLPTFLATGVLQWVLRLGGPGLILIGIADNSVIPLTGSMDVLTIWLAASHRNSWWLYGILALMGAVLGGYITFMLAREGGKEALEHRFPKKKIEKVYGRFNRWGFWAIAVPAVLPPPFPMVPFLLAAGALQYPPKKFLSALTLGRGIRFFLLAGMGAIYGTSIVAFFRQYYKPALGVLIGLAVLGSILSYIEYRRMKKHQRQKSTQRPAPKAA